MLSVLLHGLRIDGVHLLSCAVSNGVAFHEINGLYFWASASETVEKSSKPKPEMKTQVYDVTRDYAFIVSLIAKSAPVATYHINPKRDYL